MVQHNQSVVGRVVGFGMAGVAGAADPVKVGTTEFKALVVELKPLPNDEGAAGAVRRA